MCVAETSWFSCVRIWAATRALEHGFKEDEDDNSPVEAVGFSGKEQFDEENECDEDPEEFKERHHGTRSHAGRRGVNGRIMRHP